MFVNAIYNWNPAHAPVNITFVQPETFQGSGFPAEWMDLAFVSESGPTYGTGPQALGKRIVTFDLDANGQLLSGPQPFVEYVGTGQATVVGLAAGPDGLYFTELYRDEGATSPIDAGARVLRVRYAPRVTGDFNGDSLFDCADVDALVAEVVSQQHSSAFDLTGDGLVNDADLDAWLAEAGFRNLPSENPYLRGDANLDGVVDGQDFISWNSHKFTTAAGWCGGDFNADGTVDGQDFILWNTHKFTAADAGLVHTPSVTGISVAAMHSAAVLQPADSGSGIDPLTTDRATLGAPRAAAYAYRLLSPMGSRVATQTSTTITTTVPAPPGDVSWWVSP